MSLEWIVGVEPDGEHDGPLRFAAWLQEHTRDRQRITGAYVLPNIEIVDPSFGPDENKILHEKARQTCDWGLQRAGVTEAFDRVELTEADSIHDGLHGVVNEHGPYGCIIGRRAHIDEVRFQRLGPVARRLLRELHTPLVIVPPDWFGVGAGPVLLATDCAESSVAAAGFALTLARTLNVPLIAAYATHGGAWVGPHFESAVFDSMRDRIRAAGKATLAEWSKDHNLHDATQTVLLGDPVATLAGLANEEKACVMVCGSRQLGTARRLFGHSVASELAAVADVPVAVVPN